MVKTLHLIWDMSNFHMSGPLCDRAHKKQQRVGPISDTKSRYFDFSEVLALISSLHSNCPGVDPLKPFTIFQQDILKHT